MRFDLQEILELLIVTLAHSPIHLLLQKKIL